MPDPSTPARPGPPLGWAVGSIPLADPAAVLSALLALAAHGAAGLAATLPPPPPPVLAARRHSIDFCSVSWDGTDYEFTPQQAAAVRLLWEAMDAGTPALFAGTILDAIGTELTKLYDVFRDHPAWGSMIVEGGRKGTYRLAEAALAEAES